MISVSSLPAPADWVFIVAPAETVKQAWPSEPQSQLNSILTHPTLTAHTAGSGASMTSRNPFPSHSRRLHIHRIFLILCQILPWRPKPSVASPSAGPVNIPATMHLLASSTPAAASAAGDPTLKTTAQMGNGDLMASAEGTIGLSALPLSIQSATK